MTVFAYLRVSTDQQDTENQRMGVENKAKQLNLNIDKYILDEGISGAKDPSKRALGKLIKKTKKGDIILCSELSRLGRKMFMVMEILQTLIKKEIKLYTVKDNYELGDNIQSKCIAFAFSLAAEIERDLICQRTREAMARKKANGEKLGRGFGCRNKHHKLDGKDDIIKQLLGQGLPYRQIAFRLKVSPTTIINSCKRLKSSVDDTHGS